MLILPDIAAESFAATAGDQKKKGRTHIDWISDQRHMSVAFVMVEVGLSSRSSGIMAFSGS